MAEISSFEKPLSFPHVSMRKVVTIPAMQTLVMKMARVER